MKAALVLLAAIAFVLTLYRYLRRRERAGGERAWDAAARERARREIEREFNRGH